MIQMKVKNAWTAGLWEECHKVGYLRKSRKLITSDCDGKSTQKIQQSTMETSLPNLLIRNEHRTIFNWKHKMFPSHFPAVDFFSIYLNKPKTDICIKISPRISVACVAVCLNWNLQPVNISAKSAKPLNWPTLFIYANTVCKQWLSFFLILCN